MEFLINYLKDNQNIQVLDLSNNNIGNTGVKNITKLLEENKAITEINLSDNNIGTKGLNILCSALSSNRSVQYLNIKRNPIPWGANKVLHALLIKNPHILDIKYSKYDEKGKEYSESIIEPDEEDHHHFLRDEVHREKDDEDYTEKSWFRHWFCCWLDSLYQAKNEAFRFKYDAEKLAMLESKMDWITIILYINALLFYTLCISMPIIFAEHCGEGISIASHMIYMIYAIINFIFEFAIVLKIQRDLDDKNLLKINKWHIGKF